MKSDCSFFSRLDFSMRNFRCVARKAAISAPVFLTLLFSSSLAAAEKAANDAPVLDAAAKAASKTSGDETRKSGGPDTSSGKESLKAAPTGSSSKSVNASGETVAPLTTNGGKSSAAIYVPKPRGYYPGDPIPDRMVYLTFDDGPAAWTPIVLDTLRAKKIRATFFVNANWDPKSSREKNSFQKHRDTMLRMINEGHAVGNHSRQHLSFSKLTGKQMAEQLDSNQELLDRELGMQSVRMTLIRPPYGEPWFHTKDTETLKQAYDAAAPRGLVILWTRHFFSGDSMDWVKGDWYEPGPKLDITHEEFKTRMDAIYDRLINKVNGRGMIILFHDTHRTTVELLPHLIDKLKEMGYSFGTIEDYARWRWGKSSYEIISGETKK